MPKLFKIFCFYRLHILLILLNFFILTKKTYAAVTMDPGGGGGGDPSPAGLETFQNLLERIIGLSVGFAFVVVTLILFWGGIKFITSNGDQKNLGVARQMIIQALIGLAFLALAWLVIRLIEAFTGASITNFCIGFPGLTDHCNN